ncbi:MAG TPA: response regulator, partial [Terriglobales bacterium]|nr:response regulator [Terriglobales bacterium]
MSEVTTSEVTTREVAMSEVAAVSHQNPPESTPPSAGRILIIDDEAEIRESLETLLQLEGYTVAVAGSGGEGLAQIGQRAFDVVLLDLALPDKNGMDVLSEIRLLHPQQAVIMITAYGTVENAVRAMQSGATNFIQ